MFHHPFAAKVGKAEVALGSAISLLCSLALFRNLSGGWVLLSMGGGTPEAKQDGEHGKQAAEGGAGPGSRDFIFPGLASET